MPTELDFTTESGKPTTVRIVARGRRWRMTVAVAVHAVVDTGETAPDGSPIFSLAANQSLLITPEPEDVPQ